MGEFTGTYDPSKVVVTWGDRILKGFADGTFVKVEKSAEQFTKAVGSDGNVARVRNCDNSAEIAVTLMQSSETNEYLSDQAAEDELYATKVQPFQVKDLRGNTLAVAPEAWIKKIPAAEFGKEMTNREWVFDTGSCSIKHGGAE